MTHIYNYIVGVCLIRLLIPYSRFRQHYCQVGRPMPLPFSFLYNSIKQTEEEIIKRTHEKIKFRHILYSMCYIIGNEMSYDTILYPCIFHQLRASRNPLIDA